MPKEIEIKIRIHDPGLIRERLAAGGGRRVDRVLETNRLFDTTAGKLRAADQGLRLRVCRPLDESKPPAATLTWKGPRAVADVKIREELETAVADADAAALILERLGFVERVIFEKRRETWRLDACEVCIDELPELGWFVEIEGPSMEAIESVRAHLDLRPQNTVRETYVELVANHGCTPADSIPQLRFSSD